MSTRGSIWKASLWMSSARRFSGFLSNRFPVSGVLGEGRCMLRVQIWRNWQQNDAETSWRNLLHPPLCRQGGLLKSKGMRRRRLASSNSSLTPTASRSHGQRQHGLDPADQSLRRTGGQYDYTTAEYSEVSGGPGSRDSWRWLRTEGCGNSGASGTDACSNDDRLPITHPMVKHCFAAGAWLRETHNDSMRHRMERVRCGRESSPGFASIQLDGGITG